MLKLKKVANGEVDSGNVRVEFRLIHINRTVNAPRRSSEETNIIQLPLWILLVWFTLRSPQSFVVYLIDVSDLIQRSNIHSPTFTNNTAFVSVHLNCQSSLLIGSSGK